MANSSSEASLGENMAPCTFNLSQPTSRVPCRRSRCSSSHHTIHPPCRISPTSRISQTCEIRQAIFSEFRSISRVFDENFAGIAIIQRICEKHAETLQNMLRIFLYDQSIAPSIEKNKRNMRTGRDAEQRPPPSPTLPLSPPVAPCPLPPPRRRLVAPPGSRSSSAGASGTRRSS